MKSPRQAQQKVETLGKGKGKGKVLVDTHGEKLKGIQLHISWKHNGQCVRQMHMSSHWLTSSRIIHLVTHCSR